MSTQPLQWSDLDRRAVDTARLLAADAVQKAGHGHPGTAMSLAPAAYLIYQRLMRHNPADPNWVGRDRFVLSCGHSSLTQYIQLYLAGYPMTLDELKSLRTWGSQTPGHPEYGHTPGIEVTTGPLGQGIANAVGMAMAARREKGLFDPETDHDGASVFDHDIYVIASDGDLQEGVASEASSLAGHQQLGNLVVLYDDNQISIEDDTDVAFSENVGARYEAYGWHVQTVDWRATGEYTEDVAALYEAFQSAKRVSDQPSLIVLRTIIAWPAPNAQNTGASHGSALGEDEIRATKEILRFDPDVAFNVADDVIAHTQGGARERGAELQAEWTKQFDAWAQQNPEPKRLFDRLYAHELPSGWDRDLPVYEASEKGMATRSASGEFLTAAAPHLPELWGGSADLAGSNNTTPKGEPSFLPPQRSTDAFSGNWYGRVLHFGIREHAMGAILNGIALHGPTRPYGGTFLVFSDYMRPAVRLAALQELPSTFVWTHDSIGLGEDGPTHQPVEHLAALRVIPGLDVIRPADANETIAVWKHVLSRHDRPAALALTRQNVPVFPRGEGWGSADEATKGAYILRDTPESLHHATPDVLLIATGSEVQIAVAARDALATEGIAARVVSMPCREWFEEQDAEYRNHVLAPQVKARVVIEAGVAYGWHDVVGDAGRVVSLEHYGASAPFAELFERFGITAETTIAAAKESIAAVGELHPEFRPRPTGSVLPDASH